MAGYDYWPQEVSYIDVIREGRTQADYADDRLARLDLSQSTSNDGFNDRTTLFIQKMNFINNEQFEPLFLTVSLRKVE
jgi:hypothetical protein